uniref:SSD domain-containing protein n=1 Tax=Rhabditophanes sp. KR3021 TaxID=114890 RepID=A0AC35TW28_9BILA
MPSYDCIERPLSRFFFQYGQFLAKHPMLFIIFPLVVTFAMGLGLLHLNSISDAVYLFTPSDALSKMERQVIHDLWPLTNDNYIPGRAVTQSREFQIIVSTQDDGNILEPQYAEAIKRLDMYIQNRIKVTVANQTYRYEDLCLQYKHQGCPGNKHIQLISALYNHGINVTYPTVRIGDKTGYLGSALGGVMLTHGPNKTQIVASGKAWFMIYHLKFYPTNMSYISGLWEKELEGGLFNYPPDPYIKFTFFHSQTLPEELRRNANSLIPRFILSFALCVVFSAVCAMSLIKGTYYIDWAMSKPIVAILGVACAGLGIATAVGAINLCGMYYSDIVGVMPFLIVAVGIDNMFLMMASIRRSPRHLPTSERIGDCLSDAAISMFITSLTDALSFGVGCITTIPAVQIFCVYTGVAVVVTFLYEITFFAAILAISIEMEKNNEHALFKCKTVQYNPNKRQSFWTKLFMLGSHTNIIDEPHQHDQIIAEDSIPAAFFRNYFGPILMMPLVRVMSCVWFVVYMAISIYGCLQLREGLEPVNLLVEDSYAIPHYRNLEKFFWHYGAPVQIVVNNPPDLRNPLERKRIHEMIHDFANTRHTIGDDSVQFWMNEMEKYYKVEVDQEMNDDYFYSYAQHYIAAKSNEYWPEDIKWKINSDGTANISAFRFIVGMRDIANSVDQTDATYTMRDVAANYSMYNVTTFMPLWLFTDQYALVVPNTVQNIVIAMIMMIFISLFLIPQPVCAFWVTIAIFTMDIGVIGFMTLWDVNLDAISMITIIMSIGFSVDYSAHITYGYVVSKEISPTDKVIDALGALGWPLVQGAASTILAVAVLADVPAYMIVTFFKTVFLAITIGLLHGLIFLPVCLSMFVRGCCVVTNEVDCEKKQINRKVSEFGLDNLEMNEPVRYRTAMNVNNNNNAVYPSNY